MGYKTPNIDRIAREGALFTDWYGQQVAPHINCLEVQANAFDLTARYYLPSDKILMGGGSCPSPSCRRPNRNGWGHGEQIPIHGAGEAGLDQLVLADIEGIK